MAHPGGRPTKYKPEFCAMLIEHMKKYSFESFAGLDEVDVHKETLYEWANAHPEFSEAKKKAFSKNLLRLERQLVASEEISEDGPKINPGPIIYQLKFRHGCYDRPSVIEDKVPKERALEKATDAKLNEILS